MSALQDEGRTFVVTEVPDRLPRNNEVTAPAPIQSFKQTLY